MAELAWRLSVSGGGGRQLGKKLHYKGCHFHRIIGSFMLQGGGDVSLPPRLRASHLGAMHIFCAHSIKAYLLRA